MPPRILVILQLFLVRPPPAKKYRKELDERTAFIKHGSILIKPFNFLGLVLDVSLFCVCMHVIESIKMIVKESKNVRYIDMILLGRLLSEIVNLVDR